MPLIREEIRHIHVLNLKEGVSVRWSIRPSVRNAFSKTRVRRILCHVTGLVCCSIRGSVRQIRMSVLRFIRDAISLNLLNRDFTAHLLTHVISSSIYAKNRRAVIHATAPIVHGQTLILNLISPFSLWRHHLYSTILCNRHVYQSSTHRPMSAGGLVNLRWSVALASCDSCCSMALTSSLQWCNMYFSLSSQWNSAEINMKTLGIQRRDTTSLMICFAPDICLKSFWSKRGTRVVETRADHWWCLRKKKKGRRRRRRSRGCCTLGRKTMEFMQPIHTT